MKDKKFVGLEPLAWNNAFIRVMKWPLIFCFLLPAFDSYCQLGLPSGSRQGSVRPFNEFVLSDWNRKYEAVYDNVEGSPFLWDQWASGELRTLKDEYFQEVKMKANLYEGQLLHKNNFTKDSSSINLELIWEFSIPVEDSTYIFVRYRSPEKDPKPLDHFYIELSEGPTVLLAQPIVQLQKSSRSSIVNSTGKLNDRFVIRTRYYLANPEGTVFSLANKKSRSQAFGDHYGEVQKFQKSHHLQWDQPQDLAQIVAHYHQLKQ